MTVQRYFSTSSMASARRSFVTGSLVGVGLNLMLMCVGLAMLHYYIGGGRPLPPGLSADVNKDHALVFPSFAVQQLPPGFGGAILAALLAAAMSSIDSGVNSIATVLTVERNKYGHPEQQRSGSEVIHDARIVTIIAGLGIALAAYGLSFMPPDWGIVDAMPRTFNACTAPLGGMFLAGMFFPRANQRSVVAGALCGFAVSIGIGYSQEIASLWEHWIGLPATLEWLSESKLSFTWVMPCSLLTTLLVAFLLGGSSRQAKGPS